MQIYLPLITKSVIRELYLKGTMISVGPERQLESLSMIAILAVGLNIFCGLLNLVRGMVIISHGHFDVSSFRFHITTITRGYKGLKYSLHHAVFRH